MASRFILDAEAAFHDGMHIVLALRIMTGGDVHFHLQKHAFDGAKLQFYLASVVLGLVGALGCALAAMRRVGNSQNTHVSLL